MAYILQKLIRNNELPVTDLPAKPASVYEHKWHPVRLRVSRTDIIGNSAFLNDKLSYQTMHHKLKIICLFFLLLSSPLLAGETGTFSGYVYDSHTGKPLPGVDILIEGTTLGSMTDKYGKFIINGIPPGKYSARITHMGYTPLICKSLVIKADITTRLDFELELEIYQHKTVVVVTAEQILQRETMNSTEYISSESLSRALPSDTFLDSFKFTPGIINNHFRGGRQRDVVYLLDGLPIISPLSRELTYNIPVSAIEDVVISTGGFSAEYGNANAGVVNIIRKRGRNEFSASARSYTDYVGNTSIPYDNVRKIEIGFGGPMSISFGGPTFDMNYFLSLDFSSSNTPFSNQLTPFYSEPLQRNFNGTAVYDFKVTRNISLSFQGALSSWKWRSLNELSNTPPDNLSLRKSMNRRAALKLTHTLSPSMFYRLNFGIYQSTLDILGQGIIVSSPSPFKSNDPNVVTGLQTTNEPWQQESRESTLFFKGTLLKQFRKNIQIKTGVSAEYYNLSMLASKVIAMPNREMNSDEKYLYNWYYNNFEETPYTAGGFFEIRLDFSRFILQAGTRVDYLQPKSNLFTKAGPEENFKELEDIKLGKFTVSPRFSLAIPISGSDQFFANYGKYHQNPAFYYLYAGTGTSTSQLPVRPLFGNQNLAPSSSETFEIGYLKKITPRASVNVTLYNRHFSNLIDTGFDTTLDNPGQSDTQGSASRYLNGASASTRGIEIKYDQKVSSVFSGRITYTYMQATGTTNDPEQNYYYLLKEGNYPRTPITETLNWDQRNTLILSGIYNRNNRLEWSTHWRIYSPRQWIIQTPTDLVREDLPWRVFADFRISWSFMSGRYKIGPFFEVRNMFDFRHREENENLLFLERQPMLPFADNYGRRFRIGIQIN